MVDWGSLPYRAANLGQASGNRNDDERSRLGEVRAESISRILDLAVPASVTMPDLAKAYVVEPLEESEGLCDCCGEASHCVWGFVYDGEATIAAYWVDWTVGHLKDSGANLDLVIGAWEDGATSRDRVGAALLCRRLEDSPPQFMVIDATDRPVAESELVDSALRRRDVIGTPLADYIFGVVDAIFSQDSRLFWH